MPINAGKSTLEAATSLVDVTKDTDGGKMAAQELGKTALTITSAINNFLLPIAAVNFAFDKGRDYFANKFQADLKEVTSEIPADQIREPKASLAAPTLQGLAFSHEEPDLKAMYLNLLRSAMDARQIGLDHPSFAELIKQLSSEEARIIEVLLRADCSVPICEIRLMSNSDSSYVTASRHVLDYRRQDTKEPMENEELPVMVENWQRLGLVYANYNRRMVGEGKYEWVESRPEYEKAKNIVGDDQRVVIGKGVMDITDFGRKFGRAVL